MVDGNVDVLLVKMKMARPNYVHFMEKAKKKPNSKCYLPLNQMRKSLH